MVDGFFFVCGRVEWDFMVFVKIILDVLSGSCFVVDFFVALRWEGI